MVTTVHYFTRTLRENQKCNGIPSALICEKSLVKSVGLQVDLQKHMKTVTIVAAVMY